MEEALESITMLARFPSLLNHTFKTIQRHSKLQSLLGQGTMSDRTLVSYLKPCPEKQASFLHQTSPDLFSRLVWADSQPPTIYDCNCKASIESKTIPPKGKTPI
jgi:hypothetical protein